MEVNKNYHTIGIFLGTGSRIRDIRGDLTQGEFGRLFGVKQNTVSKWESGRIPDVETLKKIADYGKTTVEWLLRGDQAGQPPPGPLPPLKFPEGPPSGDVHLRQFGQEEYAATLNPLETALLVEVHTKVEEVLSSRPKLQLTPEQKARLCVRLYDDCRAQHLHPTRHHVEKLLYLVD